MVPSAVGRARRLPLLRQLLPTACHHGPRVVVQRHRPVPPISHADGSLSPQWSLARWASTASSAQNTASKLKERGLSIDDTQDSFTEEVQAVEPTQAVALRPYQQEAIGACLDALADGKRRIGVSSPTGSGKTTMFMHLIPQIPTSTERHQTLVLVGSVELALQAEAAAKRILGEGWSVEVEQSRRVASGRADVTIATYQTLNNPARLTKFDPARFKLIIVDEAHHAAALSYLRLLHYFNDDVTLPESTGPFTSFDHGNKVPIIGFSATFSRHDQLALSAAFEEIVFHRDVGHMLEEGWLAPVKSTAVYADLGLDDVACTKAGDYRAASLAAHVNTPETNSLIVKTYLHRAQSRRSTLVFAVNLKHVANLVHAFRSAGIDARSVSSHSLPQKRKETIGDFGAGRFPVLVNCEVLTEGTDIREIDCIILARPTRSKNLLAQMVGRGLRLSPESGKTDCYLIDIADNISRASGMAIAPTLFGLSYEDGAQEAREIAERVARDDDGEAERSHERDQRPISSPSSVTLVDSDDPFHLRSTASQPVAKMSPNAWVACGGDRYVLELMGLGFVTVEPSDDAPWSITFTPKLPRELVTRSPYSRRQTIAAADTLDRALNTADKYAERRAGTLHKQLSRYAPWRARPPSPKQLQMFLKMKGVDGAEGDATVSVLGKQVPLAKLKAGQVAAYLCAVQHGAMTVRSKVDRRTASALKKERAKAEKEAAAAARNLALPGK